MVHVPWIQKKYIRCSSFNSAFNMCMMFHKSFDIDTSEDERSTLCPFKVNVGLQMKFKVVLVECIRGITLNVPHS